MKIKKILQDAGLYQTLYDVQIEQVEMAIKELKQMQKIVNNEGRVITKQTKYGEETAPHPLLTIINQFHKTITSQLASLGLNRMKLEGKTAAKDAEMNEWLQD